MPIHHDTSELNTLAANLTKKGILVGSKVAQVVRRSALQLEATAKGFCPVDTGFLRGSIGTNITGGALSTEISAVVGPTANYAPYVEFGTSRMAPAAFMGPAFDRVAPDFVAAVEAVTDVGW